MELFSRPTSRTIRVALTPTPGWCIKSIALQPTICTLASPAPPKPTSSPSTLLEPASQSLDPSTLTITQGTKIFVNLAWDANVPPPPEGNEDDIQKAMRGEDDLLDHENPGWFAPVIISQPRSDIDKAGKPSVVFDAIFNNALKSRALKDIAFKTFLEELAFQRIEDQYTLQLSRTSIGRPNIRSKGKLDPRTVLIPVNLYPESHPERVAFAKKGKGKKPLVEELTVGEVKLLKEKTEKKPKGILKPSKSRNELAQNGVGVEGKSKISIVPQENEQPAFSWTQDEDRVILRVEVPRLTRAEILSSTLDIEPSRLILTIPPFYFLDLNIELPDAQMPVVYGTRAGEVSKLKRVVREREEKAFDVGGAQAEWRVGEGVVIVTL